MKRDIEIDDSIDAKIQVYADRKFGGIWADAHEDLLSYALRRNNGHAKSDNYSGWIYAVRNEGTGLTKIGMSCKPEERAYHFASQMGGLGVESYISKRHASDARLWEALVNANLAKFHHDKEWFKCGINQAIEAIEENYTSNERVRAAVNNIKNEKLFVLEHIGGKNISESSRRCGLSATKLSWLARDCYGKSHYIPLIGKNLKEGK